MQTGLDPLLGVTSLDALLMAVFMDQSGGVQVQGVAFRPAAQLLQGPTIKLAKTTLIGRLTERAKKTAQGRLRGHALDLQNLRQERIGTQMRHARQFVR